MKKSLEAIVDDLIESVEEQEGFQKCVFCPKRFKAMHNLKKHVMKDHKFPINGSVKKTLKKNMYLK